MKKTEFWLNKEKKTVDPELYSSRAETVAKIIANDNTKMRKHNKRTQIRKFYDEVTRLNMEAKMWTGINTAAETKAPPWDDIAPLVHMIIAKAAYARGRDLVSDNFVGFIKNSIQQVKDVEDLNVFANFFEAFMGFYRLHGPTT